MTVNGQRRAPVQAPVGPARFELGLFVAFLTEGAALVHADFDEEEACGEDGDETWDMKLTKSQIARLCVDALASLGQLDCVWCGVDTVEIAEYYMVHDELWDEFGPIRGCLCVGCLERQMGRELCPDDFTDAPVNRRGRRSERLRTRLGIRVK